MSGSLARRTGTVGALVAAAGVTLVAGAWPALAAAPTDPRSAEVQGVGVGLETAPGQQPVVDASPIAEPVVEATASPAVEPVVEPVVEPSPVGIEPVVEEQIETPARGRTSTAPGRGPGRGKDPLVEASATPTAEPTAEPTAAPTAAAQGGTTDAPVVGPPTGVGKGRDKATGGPAAPPAGPAPAAEPAPPAQAQGHGVTGDRGRPVAEPTAPPVAAGPAVRPGSVAPVAEPAVVPPAPAPPVVMGPHVPRTVTPSALATAGSRAGRPQVAAADALPLRPTGAEPIVLAVARPRAVPVDLGTALPTVAVTTAAAVASTPEWPLGIAAVVLVFLLVQNRIDRRDPKLGQARLEDDAPLEFATPAGRPALRVVPAA